MSEEWERKLAYYRRQLDDVAGENLRKDYEISGLRKEIRHRIRAFALLSELHERIGVHRDIGAILQTVMTSITGSLGMDRTVILRPAEAEHQFIPWFWTGFTEEGRAAEFEHRLREFSVTLPQLQTRGSAMLVNRQTEPDATIQCIQDGLETPFFVCVPVIVDDRVIALILSGRVKETATVFAPLSESDVETFRAITGLVSAVVQNMRVAVLEETNRLKTDFFANISHEFRTPITLSLGPIDSLLQRRYGELPEAAANQLRVIESSQRRLLRLVNQLLDVAKSESGAMQLRCARVPSFSGFVASRVDHFAGLAEKRSIALHVDTDPALETVDVFVDPEKVDRILLNLLSNAHKFTPAGGTVTVSTRREGDEALIVVADSGVGVPPDQLPHIFDRFRQADGSRSRDFVGTGIGLALVKEFSELHRGSVQVASTVGRGATFTVRLPLGSAHLTDAEVVAWRDEDAQTLALSEASVDVGEGAEDVGQDGIKSVNAEAARVHDDDKPTVLFVDDNRALRGYVRDLLVDTYNIYVGCNGKEGLSMAAALRPDLILSDMMMPKMNGAQFCQALRKDPELSSIPFIMLTAKASTEDRIVGLEDGADDFLSKPFAERELRARLRNMIRMREQELRLSREVGAAQEIQRMLLPRWPLEVSGFRLDAYYEPCDELSGDFFDVVVRDGVLWVYLADVTSHGAASAQVTLLLKQIFREALEHDQPRNVVGLLQAAQQRYAGLGLEYDVGIQAVRLQMVDGVLEYASGNAPVPLHQRDTGSIAPVVARPGPGLTARAEATAEYECTTVALEAGDSLHLYTDGCVEFTAQRRRFGTRRLVRLLGGLRGVDEWASGIQEALEGQRDGPAFEDDLTVLRLRRAS